MKGWIFTNLNFRWMEACLLCHVRGISKNVFGETYPFINCQLHWKWKKRAWLIKSDPNDCYIKWTTLHEPRRIHKSLQSKKHASKTWLFTFEDIKSIGIAQSTRTKTPTYMANFKNDKNHFTYSQTSKRH